MGLLPGQILESVVSTQTSLIHSRAVNAGREASENTSIFCIMALNKVGLLARNS